VGLAENPELVWPFPAEATIKQNSTTSFLVILPLKKRLARCAITLQHRSSKSEG
jgi:hypothetical protein